MTAIEIVAADDIITLISKARSLGIIQKMSFNKPLRSVKAAEKKVFRAAGEESD